MKVLKNYLYNAGYQILALIVPLIISFGSPYLIALARQPGPSDRQLSFTAGLHAGPVNIESDGRAESVQVDFTPLGAYRFFGGAIGRSWRCTGPRRTAAARANRRRTLLAAPL